MHGAALLPLRAGANDELLYALRSWQAHAELRPLVAIGGHHPHLRFDVHLAGNVGPGPKAVRSTRNQLHGLRWAHRKNIDHVWLLNDDFFLVADPPSTVHHHAGPLRTYIDQHATKSSRYYQSAVATLYYLEQRGHHHPWSYDLHLPMRVHVPTMLSVVEQVMAARQHQPPRRGPTLWMRTIYGNLWGRRHDDWGTYSDDVKVYDHDTTWDEHARFVSTTDDTFTRGAVGAALRARYTTPSRWER